MPPERTSYDQKLDAILDGAAVVFAEQGFHGASIREVSRSTGVSLSGLYYYFQSKEELLYLIQDRSLGTLLDAVERALDGIDDPAGRLRAFISSYLTYFVGNMAKMKVLSHEAESLSGEFKAKVSAKKRAFIEIATSILKGLRPDSDLDPRVAVFSLFGMMNWIYTWYRPGRDVDIERLVSDMSRIYLDGYLEYDSADMRV